VNKSRFSSKKIYDKVLEFIKFGPINLVAFTFSVLGICWVVSWILIRNLLAIKLPDIFESVIVSIGSVAFGAIGLVYIYRREMPGPTASTTIKGWFAVIVGVLLLLFFCGLGMTILLSAFFNT
jgi:hypothetical protein